MQPTPIRSSRALGLTPHRWPSLLGGVLIGAVVALLSVDVLEDERLREGIRLTGRVSFLFFLVPWTARPLDRLLDRLWTRWLVERRGQFGLAFAGNHVAHLALIVLLYDVSAGPPVSDAVRIGGALGILDLAAMATLTFPEPVQRVGPRVTAFVHRFALHYLAWIFFYDLALKNGFGAHPLLLSLWVGAGALRLSAWLAERRSLSAVACEVTP